VETYEYQILEASSLINQEQLSDQAKKGWRLVTIVPDNGKFFFYFEKFVLNNSLH